MPILVKTQFNDLRGALDAAIVAVADLSMMLQGIGHPLESIVVPTGLSKPMIFSIVIKTAEDEGWTRALIREAVRLHGGNQRIIDFIAAHPEHDPAKPPPVAPDYYETDTLVGGQVFLRRPSIRKNMKVIGVDTKPRAMYVIGPRFTGKTYSRDFISFVLENDPVQKMSTQKIVYVDLDKFPPGPPAITRRIGKKLGIPEADLPKDKGEQDARQLSDLIETIVDAATNHAAAVVWFVLDGFHTKQPTETDDFVTALVKEVNRTTKLRLVLLNYRPPPLIAPFLLKEEIEAEPFDNDNMKAFIRSVYDRIGKPYDSQSVDKALNDVLQSVQEQLAAKPEDKDRRLEYLSSGLAIAAQRLAG